MEQAGFGIKLSDRGNVGELSFADDLLRISESGEQLQ